MITGANTNVRYRGILFHVQTEDSGRANPHIISHVYHGGTILGSQKTDYSDQLEAEDLIGVVRGLIDQQHATMLEKLNSGGFDAEIAARLGDTASEAGIEAPPSSKPDTQPDSLPESDTEIETPAPPPAPQAAAPPTRGFGEGAGAEKPLDEVILDYLAEKARDRSGGATRKSRPDG